MDKKTQLNTVVTKSLWIENPHPFFVWSEIEPSEALKNFIDLPKKNTNTSIFIYNKHQRPLKVSCEFFWVQPESIYPFKKATILPLRNQSPLPMPMIAKLGKNPQLQFFNEPGGEISLLEASYRKGKKYQIDKSFNNDNRGRKHSLVSSRNNSLSKSHRTRIVSDHRMELLSETLNIRRKWYSLIITNLHE